MANIMQDAVEFLGSMSQDAAGVSITYARAAGSVSLTATIYQQDQEVVDTEGFVATSLDRDYVVHAADLVIGGNQIEPRTGDRITEAIAGTSVTFEVIGLGDAREWEPHDNEGIRIIIHSKKIA